MGFDGQGRFHIRLAMAEGFDAGWLLAVPYDAAGKQMGSTLEQTAVDGGMDYTIGGVAPDDVADMASIRVYGAYRGPEAAIEGEWSLPVELEPAEQRVIPVGRTLEGGFYVERIEVSGMNIAVYYRGGDKDWFVVWATDKSGVRTGVPMGMMSAGAEDGLNLGLWSFETPAALDELASVTLLGRPSPWNKGDATAGNNHPGTDFFQRNPSLLHENPRQCVQWDRMGQRRGARWHIRRAAPPIWSG